MKHALSSLLTRLSCFCREHRYILLVMVLLFAERLLVMHELGIMYTLNSDDISYINSGLHFIKTGTITMHNEYPSAQIMPGMTVLIGLFSLLFGEGKLLWLALKLFWFLMSALTAWYVYRAVGMFAPKWCGVLAALSLFRPDFAWMDNIILTETPFLLALTAMVYYTFRMGRDSGHKSFCLCTVFYLFGLMLKANIALYPLFAFVYLLFIKYDIRRLLKQTVVLSCAVLCFVIPWSIRNYIHFDTFIPLTYGAGNPTLLGTYQGTDYPLDEKLDYETNVTQVVKEKYAKYHDEEGNVLPQYQRYVALERDGIKAKYRQKVWWETDWKSMLYSYAIYKPQQMINSIYYSKAVLNINAAIFNRMPYFTILFCFMTLAAAMILKKHRAAVFLAFSVYLINIYIYALTFSFNRYNASLISMQWIVMGIGISLLIQLALKGIRSIRKFENI